LQRRIGIYTLVHLAREAPFGGVVDVNGFAGREEILDAGLRPRFPDEAIFKDRLRLVFDGWWWPAKREASGEKDDRDDDCLGSRGCGQVRQ
jgi:hypothetical protein